MAVMLTALLPLLNAGAQSTDEAWRTVHTEHFRLHYPADSEAWALHAAQRLEAIRALVAPAVGHEPSQIADIVVMDPFAQANGFAIPFLNGPRMGVFPTAPDPASGIGHYRSWAEDLILHEDVHLVHMLRPSRNPAMRLILGGMAGLSPISLESPAWVVEGYATVLEGRLTGLGRPHSDSRAAFLRTLAADGQLPTYTALDAPKRWSSGSYRYLVGSAYLEWLEAGSHEGALRDLWARMTAREIRSFEDAFEGVFGNDPATLYARFVAELTHEALRLEALRPVDVDTLWQDLSSSTGSPSVSPSGDHVATILRPKNGPPRLVAWRTEADPEAAARWEAANQPDLEKDPEDVAPVAPAVFEREPAFSRVVSGRSARQLRWIDDESILFTDFVTDGSGDVGPDLFTWQVSTGRISRVTRGGHVRDADPRGDRAVALRTRHGLSEIVSVELNSGELTPLIEAGPETVYAQPRLSPDGHTLAWLENTDGWRILSAAVDGTTLAGAPAEVPLPAGRSVLSITWHPSGSSLIASLGHAGFIELYELPLGGGGRQLTLSRSSALAPAPTPDGQAIFFLSPDVEGLNLHRFSIASSRATGWSDDQLRVASGQRASVTPLPPTVAPPLETAAVAPQRYGAGRTEVRLTAGTTHGPEQGTGEFGLWLGDVVGRHEILALYSARESEPGVRAAITWRGLPLRVRLDGALLGMSTPIAELSVARLQHWEGGSLDLHLGGWSRENDLSGGATLALEQGWWTGPVQWRGHLTGEGSAGSQGRSATAGSGLSVGHTFTTLGISGMWGATERPFTLGGLPDPLLPELSDLARVWAPGLAPGSDSGPTLQHLRAEFGLWNVLYFFAEHYTLQTTHSQLGLEARTDVSPQPLARIAAMELTAGVSCRLIDDGERDQRVCSGPEDLSGWLGVLIRPGRPPALPVH